MKKEDLAAFQTMAGEIDYQAATLAMLAEISQNLSEFIILLQAITESTESSELPEGSLSRKGED